MPWTSRSASRAAFWIAEQLETAFEWWERLGWRLQPRAKHDPSVPPITLALYSDHVSQSGPRPTFDDICKSMAAEQNDLMREIPFKETI